MDRDFRSKSKDPLAYDVTNYFPEADHGSILITSRLSALHKDIHGRGLRVDKMGIVEAQQLLENNAEKPLKGMSERCLRSFVELCSSD